MEWETILKLYVLIFCSYVSMKFVDRYFEKFKKKKNSIF